MNALIVLQLVLSSESLLPIPTCHVNTGEYMLFKQSYCPTCVIYGFEGNNRFFICFRAGSLPELTSWTSAHFNVLILSNVKLLMVKRILRVCLSWHMSDTLLILLFSTDEA